MGNLWDALRAYFVPQKPQPVIQPKADETARPPQPPPPPMQPIAAIGATPAALKPPEAAPRVEPRKASKKTLASVVGVATASLLFVAIPQEESGRKVTAQIDAQTGQATIHHVSGRQYLKVYLDIVQVATACDGITTYQGKPLKVGMSFTEAQCTDMLEEELIKHAEAVMKLTPGLALNLDPVAVGPRFAAVSLAYNVGVGNYAKSTMRKDLNAFHYREACDALLPWNKAGGRVNKGLDGRRHRERLVCLKTV